MKDITRLIGATDDERIKWLIYFGNLACRQPTLALSADELVRLNQQSPQFDGRLKQGIEQAKAALDELYATVVQQLNEQHSKGE